MDSSKETTDIPQQQKSKYKSVLAGREGYAAAVFLPGDVSHTPSIEYKKEIKLLEQHFEQHKQFFTKFMPFIQCLQKKYPASPLNDELNENGKRKSDCEEPKPSVSTVKNKDADPECVYPRLISGGHVMLGGKGTTISYADYSKISWESATVAARTFLDLMFPQNILATHILTGEPSFHGHESLSENVIDDIIECVLSRVTDASERNTLSAIATKCADD